MRRRKTLPTLLITAVLALAPGAFAWQEEGASRALGAPMDGTNLPIQKIGPQDLIAIQVYDSPEFSIRIRVLDSGEIRLPMMKQLIKVEGLFPDDIAARIADELKKEHLLIDPFVTVTVQDYHSRPISVTGAVKLPTIFQAIGNVNLLDALAKAGGPADNAGGEIIVTRPNGPNGAMAVQRIPIKALNDGSDSSLNVKLEGGDQVKIPIIGTVTVMGNVHLSGIFPVQDTGTTTVMTAIAQAQGLGDFHPQKVYIYRGDEQGVRHEIVVDLTGILKRKTSDVVLRSKDILYVPDNTGKKTLNTIILAATGVSTQAASGALIYRKF